MERYMYQDDSFERMLKQKTDEYRMYPSDKTWASIQNKLHKPANRFHWKAVSFVLLLTLISIQLSNGDTVQLTPLLSPDVAESVVAENKLESKTLSVINKSVKRQRSVLPINLNTNIVNRQTDQNTIAEVPVAKLSAPAPEKIIAVKPPVAEVTAVVSEIVPENVTEYQLPELVSNEHIPVSYKPFAEFMQPSQLSAATLQPVSLPVIEEPVENKTDADLNYEVNVPVVTRKKETRKLQVYAAPSASYRVLEADNKFKFGNIPLDPENEVTHHIALGWEAGTALLFPVTKRLKFRTGLQVNYTRYDVEAFKALPSTATVRLNNAGILNRPAALGNETGLLIKEVANETYQLSIPVGLEFAIVKGKKLQWTIAGNIQPTYLMKASGYLVTNDYKNYIKAPDLLSNMNVNTALETFFRWDAGSFEMQAGPQFRYQLFSNVRGSYPIREHLVDYGFKIGFIKTLK